MQAARGAPLNEPDPSTPASVGDRGPGRLPLLLAVAGGVLALDVFSKLLAVEELSDREPISLLGGLLTLRLVRNPGAAFGMAQGMTIVFTCVAVAVVVVILRMARRTNAGASSGRWITWARSPRSCRARSRPVAVIVLTTTGRSGVRAASGSTTLASTPASPTDAAWNQSEPAGSAARTRSAGRVP